MKGTLALALRRTLWFRDKALTKAGRPVAHVEGLHFPLTDALLLNCPTRQRARNSLSHETYTQAPPETNFYYVLGEEAHCKARHCPSRLKVSWALEGSCHHLTRASSPARKPGVGARREQAWVCSCKSFPELQGQRQNTRASLLGLQGTRRLLSPLPPPRSGLTSQTLVRGPGPGNSHSLLLGSPPAPLHPGLCVAVKASFPFTVSVVLPG